MRNETQVFGPCRRTKETKYMERGLKAVEIGGRIEAIQTTARRRSAKILRRDLDTLSDSLLLQTSEKNHQTLEGKNSHNRVKELTNLLASHHKIHQVSSSDDHFDEKLFV